MDFNANNRLSSKQRAAVVCFKFSLISVSALLTLLGFTLIGTGIIVRLAEDFQFSLFTHLAIASVSIGVVTIFIGVVGCCSVVVRRTAVHITFISSVIIGLLATAVVCCWLVLQRNAVLEESRVSLRNAVAGYFTNDTYRQFINNVQHRLECCGAEFGFSDYGAQLDLDADNVCEMQFYAQPCHQPLWEYLSQKLILVLAINVSTGVVLLLEFLLSLVMFCLLSLQMTVEETV